MRLLEFEYVLPETGVDLNQEIDRMERSMADQALRRTNGNIAKASALLGIGRTNLWEKVKRYNRVEWTNELRGKAHEQPGII